MRNLQNRSGRYASIIAGVFASLVALAVVSQNPDGSSTLAVVNQYFLIASAVAFAIGLISLGLFLASMAHMPTLEVKNSGFMKKTIGDWERHVARHLCKFEKLHWWGGVLFSSSIFVFIVGGGAALIFLGT